MNNKLIVLGTSALILGGFVMSPKLAEAYRNDPNVQGPNCSPERHDAMIQAFENEDYNAWKELMQGKGRVSEIVDEDNFARFAEAHRLALEGNTEEAEQIRAELGLGLGRKHRSGDGLGNGSGKGKGRWSTEDK